MVSVAMFGAAGVSGRGAWRIPAEVLGPAPAVAIWLAPPMRPDVRVFEGDTVDLQSLVFTPEAPLTNVTVIRVETTENPSWVS